MYAFIRERDGEGSSLCWSALFRKRFLILSSLSQDREKDLILFLGLCEEHLCLQMHNIKVMLSETVQETFFLFTE